MKPNIVYKIIAHYIPPSLYHMHDVDNNLRNIYFSTYFR